MLKKLSRLSRLSPADWLLLPQLVLSALVMRLCLKVMPLPRLTGFLARGAQHRGLQGLPLLHSRYEVARLVELADLATRVTHGQARCLARSLLLFWLLKTREEPVELLLGISKEAATLRGHAWIEKSGGVLGDSPELTGRFATLLRF